jgi:hypothetical protein
MWMEFLVYINSNSIHIPTRMEFVPYTVTFSIHVV